MTLAYYFHMQSVPRTVTRAEWYKTWRNVRVQRKQIDSANIHFLNFFTENKDKMPDYVRQDMIAQLINPPIALGPYM